MDFVRKPAPLVIHDHDAALRHGRDIRGPAASGKAGSFAVVFHPMGIQIAEAVDLRAADKTEIDAASLQKVHDLV